MKDQTSGRRSGRSRPGTRQIYEELKGQIEKGVYAPGSVMPSTRSLAAELGVARATVTLAYEQLLSEGFIESKQGARTRVAALRPLRTRTTYAPRSAKKRRLSKYGERLTALFNPAFNVASNLIVDFRYGDLSAADFPTLLWKQAVDTTIRQRRYRLAYDDPRGSLALRLALQGYLWRARGIRSSIEQIIVLNGSQQGLDLCSRLLVDPGDIVVVEDPCYVMARRTFMAVGAEVSPVEADEEGLKTPLLRDIAARLAYVTPSHQYPLGGVMPVARRNELLSWSRHYGAYVIEDDYDSEYRYDIAPVPPLHVMDGAEQVIYLGTLSKTLSPTLRLGYLVVPPELSSVFAAAKQLADRHTPLLEQEAVAALISSGAYERHIRKTRRRNAARRASLLNALQRELGDRLAVCGSDAGLHVIVWCSDIPAHREDELIEVARQARVGLYPVTPTYANAKMRYRPDCAGLVMGYAGLSEVDIELGVQMLAKVLAEHF
ncbi:DNA-binding protein [Burkholderia lata]|uniref:DNA-binding protein n=1 Tax=Burkholderia lata (strain ATCC 17760 / DSM 23089 / LMG 22485 / NCIMB 9086 / R18194 / 383) TaxID=482957 RepID=A0A6P2V0N0_BURL3|nr:PLP-dependent aminotransferase family protein [Burkholderia lata]VWC76654.1 DNA-binding protein [Burkholderia lata]